MFKSCCGSAQAGGLIPADRLADPMTKGSARARSPITGAAGEAEMGSVNPPKNRDYSHRNSHRSEPVLPGRLLERAVRRLGAGTERSGAGRALWQEKWKSTLGPRTLAKPARVIDF